MSVKKQAMPRDPNERAKATVDAVVERTEAPEVVWHAEPIVMDFEQTVINGSRLRETVGPTP